MIEALIFDVDGTLAETEECHRVAFNAAFAEAGLDWCWDVELYRDLLRTTGGRERMRRYAMERGLGADAPGDAELARLHARKSVLYQEMVRTGACPLRPGVERLIRTSHARGIKLAICTTTSRANIDELAAANLGEEGLRLFAAIVSGEDVREKKPAPDAYFRAIEALGLRSERCLAFEDSRNGLLAARAAGLRVAVTPSLYTSHENFDGAAMVLPDLGQFDLDRVGFDAAEDSGLRGPPSSPASVLAERRGSSAHSSDASSSE